jgi:DNA-binding response OmpR family regulator
MSEGDAAVVLVVDDEEEVAEVFSLWLQDVYETRVATGGEAALEAIDGVDLVLLDRRMPDLSGDETLERMRERGYDGPVAMVTAVDPDFDIVEMAFDDYLVKPISKEELHETAERLLSVQNYDSRTQDQFALARKLAALEVEKDEAELEASEEYAELRRQFEEAQGALDDAFADMDEQARTALLEDLEGDRDEPSA